MMQFWMEIKSPNSFIHQEVEYGGFINRAITREIRTDPDGELIRAP